MCLQKINLTTYITYIALPQHYFNYEYKNIRFRFGDFNAYTLMFLRENRKPLSNPMPTYAREGIKIIYMIYDLT